MKVICRYCGREYDTDIHGRRCPYDFSENLIPDSDMKSKKEYEGGVNSGSTPTIYGLPRIKDNDPYERMQEEIYGPPPIANDDVRFKKELTGTLYGPPPVSSSGFFERLLKKLGLK